MIRALLFAAVVQRWLLVNDIHLDPFFRDNTLFGAGDTTPVLWRDTLREMRKAVPNPTVVIVGGDLMAHIWRGLARDARQDPTVAAVATTREIADGLAHVYPHARFLVALGNNDDPCGDYRSETGGEYLKRIADIWAPLVQRDGAAPNFRAEFMRGGYYTATLPTGERAVVMNSVFWSFLNRGGCESHTSRAGSRELAWLQSQLGSLPRGVRAVTLMHIPPGYDPQTTADTARGLWPVPFLGGDVNRAVIQTFGAERDKIAFAVGAHTHRYDFRVVSGVPMVIGSSISPVYGNNPAFFELDVDARGDLSDVVPYSLDPYSFDGRYVRRPSFDQLYEVQAPTAAAMTEIAARIRNDAPFRSKWILAHDAWAHIRHAQGWVAANSCAQTELEGGFATCAGVVSAWWRIGGLVIGVLALALTYILLRRRVDSGT